MPWDAITSIATSISMIAFILTSLYVRAELNLWLTPEDVANRVSGRSRDRQAIVYRA
jgi:hypothetical protein